METGARLRYVHSKTSMTDLHGDGNLTLNFLPAGVDPLVNATDNARTLMQKKLATLFAISGNKQTYLSAVRAALKQAEQAVSAIPQLASMLRDSGADMTAFIEQASVLAPDIKDKSHQFADCILGGGRKLKAQLNMGSFDSSGFEACARGVTDDVAARADGVQNSALGNATSDAASDAASNAAGIKAATDEYRKNPEVLASLIEKLPELQDGMAAWSTAKQTLFTKNYIFDELVDLALSVVPVRTQVTCVCDPNVTRDLPNVIAEGVARRHRARDRHC